MVRAKLITRFLFLNQMAGPLFRELCIDAAEAFPEPSLLNSGSQEALTKKVESGSLLVRAAPAYNRQTGIQRVVSWLRYAASSFFLLIQLKPGTAVLFASNPPIIGPLVWILSKLKGFPYIILIYDLHPDVLVSFGILRKDNFLIKIWRSINKVVYESAGMVLTIGDRMVKRLESQFDVGRTDLGRVGLLPPWADTEKIRPMSKDANPLAEEFGQKDVVTVLYSGNFGISHDIQSMLEACLLLKDRRDIKFLFIGGGEKFQSALDFGDLHQLETLSVLPYQSDDRLPYSLALGEISLVALDEGAEGLMLPSKISYYMAAGSAIVGICRGKNDLRDIIETYDCGFCIEPRRPADLAGIILRIVDSPDLLKHFRKNARRSAESVLSRAVCSQKLKALLREVGYM